MLHRGAGVASLLGSKQRHFDGVRHCLQRTGNMARGEAEQKKLIKINQNER